MPDTDKEQLPSSALEPLLNLAIQEDIGEGDLTGNATVSANQRATAHIVAKEEVVACGLPIWSDLMNRIAPDTCSLSFMVSEGTRATPGTRLATMHGPARALLAGERIAMNLICHLTGIATFTSRFVAIAGELKVLDTRKTTPGQRLIEKYAVRIGGGNNHRMSLDTGILIKENHITSCGSLEKALRQAKEIAGQAQVECEVQNLEELEDAIKGGADAVLLDNMSNEEILECARLAKARAPGVFVEASGNMSMERIASLKHLVKEGLHAVSVGALTHSRPYADLSMLMTLEGSK